MAITGLKDICTPAMVYFLISMVSIILIGLQNLGNNGQYCVGSFSCETTSVVSIFLVKIVYVVFWTWLLNIICKSGYETVSWVIVLLPFLLLFVMVAYILLTHVDSSKYTPSF
jgi:hypothetical protein